jgi:adenosylcobinamide-GDP ribazoletransferase
MRAGEPARAALAAVTFLTRLPVGGAVRLDAGDLARGAVFFPLVGAGTGAAVGGAAFGLARVLPALAAGGLALALGAVLTGALHLDGLADTADALGGGTREAALAIMRDHRIGAYGASALALDLIVKAASLAALAPHARVVVYALAAGALSRAVPVVLAAVLPGARDDGLAASFRVSTSRAAAAVAVAIALSFATGLRDGPVLVDVGAFVAAGLGVAFRRRFGGVTGDLLGAATELVETAVLVAAAGLA